MRIPVMLAAIVLLATSAACEPKRNSPPSDTLSARPASDSAAAIASPRVTPADTGPSLAETVQWLSREALPMLTVTQIATDRSSHMLVTSKWRISSLAVNDCVLSWTKRLSFTISSPTGEQADPGKPFKETVPLKEVDVGGISVIDLPPSQTSDVPTPRVRIPIRGQEGPATGLDVRNRGDGERVAKALKTAATLCGASTQPF